MDTFYYCALDENTKTCPRQGECKRYVCKQGVPKNENANAKLFNICNESNRYKLFMKLDKKEDGDEKTED